MTAWLLPCFKLHLGVRVARLRLLMLLAGIRALLDTAHSASSVAHLMH